MANRWLRALLPLPFAAAIAAALWWRGPNWSVVGHAFAEVGWLWVVAAIGFNLLSIVVRSLCWHTVIRQAMAPPRPRFLLVFSAFCVGLFANATLPGRVGELARVAVLARRLPRRQGLWAALVGTVFGHRMFDLFPSVGLVAYVLATARIPAWATTSLIAIVGTGVGLFAFALAVARRQHHGAGAEALGTARLLLARGRQGLGVLRAPLPASAAVLFQCLGWLCQLFAVWTAMRAFHLHLSLPAAGLVLVLMNVATILPLWPGNVGLLQAAIALPLAGYYGVAYGRGFAFGIGLQAIEASVGIGVGVLFLAREGVSVAMLRRFRDPGEAAEPTAAAGGEVARARAGVPR